MSDYKNKIILRTILLTKICVVFLLILPVCSAVFSFVLGGDITSFSLIIDGLVKRLLLFPIFIPTVIIIGWLMFIPVIELGLWWLSGFLCIALACFFRHKKWGYVFISLAMAIWMTLSVVMVA